MEQAQHQEQHDITFKELGVCEEILPTLKSMKYVNPTDIQKAAIPLALAGRDVIGLAKTGSGKTAAFGIPMIQALLDENQPFFGLVLIPTRELAFQIASVLKTIGSGISLRVGILVGGIDTVEQQLQIANRPHILIATPGRLIDHLATTKGFNLKRLKWLVLDEADRLLSMDFERDIDTILQQLPKNRRTMLFSATLNTKVRRLLDAGLSDPVTVKSYGNSDDGEIIEGSDKNTATVTTLMQKLVVCPMLLKHIYLGYVMNSEKGKSCIIFANTVISVMKLTEALKAMGFAAVPVYGKLTQEKRIANLQKFTTKEANVLVATDVAARGLDIKNVEVVINYDLPNQTSEYIHRVGRTARAGKSGVSISFVTQYDLPQLAAIEEATSVKMEKIPIDKDDVMKLKERVESAWKIAELTVKNMTKDNGRSEKESYMNNINGKKSTSTSSKFAGGKFKHK